MDSTSVPRYWWHFISRTLCNAFSVKCWLVTSCMTYLESLSLLSCNAKGCRNTLHDNSTMPSSYLASKLFQSLPGGKTKGLCLLYHTCLLPWQRISKIQKGGGTNLTKDQGLPAFQSRLHPSEWLQGALLQSCSSPHHSKKHFCRFPLLPAKRRGT